MTRRVFELDGAWHEVGDEDCCVGDTCRCGGVVHYQPTYGGYFEGCDRCDPTITRRVVETDKDRDTLDMEGP